VGQGPRDDPGSSFWKINNHSRNGIGHLRARRCPDLDFLREGSKVPITRIGFIFFNLFLINLFFRQGLSIYSPGWPGTCYVSPGWPLIHDSPVSASQVLRSQVYATLPGKNRFYDQKFHYLLNFFSKKDGHHPCHRQRAVPWAGTRIRGSAFVTSTPQGLCYPNGSPELDQV
jgi:hypothetical protein